MDNKSVFLRQSVLTNLIQGTTFYVALYTTTPTAPDDTGGVEVSTTGTAYARTAVTFNTGPYDAGGMVQAVSNDTSVTFSTATASWGTVVGVGIYDAVTAGNLYYFGDVDSPQLVGIGDDVVFNTGSLVLQEA